MLASVSASATCVVRISGRLGTRRATAAIHDQREIRAVWLNGVLGLQDLAAIVNQPNGSHTCTTSTPDARDVDPSRAKIPWSKLVVRDGIELSAFRL